MTTVSRLVWRVLDWLDYRIWDARLRVVDALHGREPETEADRERRRQSGGFDAGAGTAGPIGFASGIERRHGLAIGRTPRATGEALYRWSKAGYNTIRPFPFRAPVFRAARGTPGIP